MEKYIVNSERHKAQLKEAVAQRKKKKKLNEWIKWIEWMNVPLPTCLNPGFNPSTFSGISESQLSISPHPKPPHLLSFYSPFTPLPLSCLSAVTHSSHAFSPTSIFLQPHIPFSSLLSQSNLSTVTLSSSPYPRHPSTPSIWLSSLSFYLNCPQKRTEEN